jgi:hypothetical protein
MFLLQCGGKKYDERSYKHTEIHHQKNKSIESTQLMDVLGTNLGLLVENYCLMVMSMSVCLPHFPYEIHNMHDQG